METYRSLGSLSDMLTDIPWPVDFFAPEDLPAFLNKIYVIDYQFDVGASGFAGSFWLAFEGELALNMLGFEGVKIVAGSNLPGYTFVNASLSVGEDIALTLHDVRLSMRFDPGILKPATFDENETVGEFVEIQVEGSIRIDRSFNISLKGFEAFRLTPVMIGDTGIVIAANNVKLDFSRTETLPEIAAAGFDESFMGIFIGDAKVKLPEGLPDLAPEDLIIRNCAIGSGGVSGRLFADYSDNPPTYDEVNKTFTGRGAGKFFGIPFGITGVEIEFKQNALKESKITGEMFLPFFDKRLGVEIGLGLDGGFTVKLASAIESGDYINSGLLTLKKPGVLEIKVESLGFQVQDGTFIAKLSGEITPLYQGLNWPSFHVNEFLIDSKGHVHLDGGWINLKNQKAMNFYGFQVEITKLGFGKTEDGGKWIGLSGGIKLVDALPAGASVEGLRIVWYDDPLKSPSLSFNGVGVEFQVPGVLQFKGAIAYSGIIESSVVGYAEKEKIQRFDGSIKLKLTAINMEIDAALVIGSASGPRGNYSFFAIYLGVELPAGIPLFSTGLALYGMAGLFATQMEPNKREEEGWYENPDGGDGWYRRDKIGVTDLANKWGPNLGSLALGAGVTIGTLPDNGNSFHGKFLLVIVLPGPIILLEGRGDLLKKRADNKETAVEPLFRAIAVLDNRVGTFTIGLDAQYKYNEQGDLIDIHGSAEAFFDFHNGDAWHIYMGRKDPREKRIRALFFKKLFEANAYFMLQGRQPILQAGVWVGFAKGWNFAPVAVNLEAFIEGGAIVSTKPPHYHGELMMYGSVKVSLFGFGIVLSVDARCITDVFEPWILRLDLHVKVDLPFPFPDFDQDFTHQWGPKKIPPPLPVLLKEIAVEHFKVTTSWPLLRGTLLLPDYDTDKDDFLNPSSGPTQPVNFPNEIPVVPLDCRPHITFVRHVNDDALVGVHVQTDAEEKIGDPTKGPVKVRYALKGLGLHRWDSKSSNWILKARKGKTGVQIDDDAVIPELSGSWAPLPSLTSESNVVDQVKLWLWSKNPFDYSRHSGRDWDEWFTSQYPNYPCVPPAKDQNICCEIGGIDPNKLSPPKWKCPDHPEIEVSWIDPDGNFNPNEVTISLPPENKGVNITLSKNQTDIAKICINFKHTPSGGCPNPLIVRRVRFEVQDKNGNLKSDVQINGNKELDCKSRLIITLPGACSSVSLTFTRFASSGTIEVFNTKGLVATEKIQTQTKFSGNDITRIVVQAPETFLQELCFEPVPITVTCSDRSGTIYDSSTVDSSTIKVTGKEIISVHLSGEYPLQIEKICISLPPDPADVIVREEMRKHLVKEMATWSKTGEVLEPDTIYRLTVVTEVKAEGEGEQLNNYSYSQIQTEYAFFRTEGPPGLKRLMPPKDYPNKDKFESGLDDLTRYVRQTMPATVPDPGQKPPLPRPVYRAYDVSVKFNEDYVDLMYRMARRDLGLYLFNSNNQPVRDAQGRLIILSNRWGEEEKLKLTENEERWIKVVNDSTCAKLDEQTIPHAKILSSIAQRQVLDADTIYEARLIPLLLHEDFASYTVGTGVNGPAGTLGGWTVKDEGTNNTPSHWDIGQVGTPPSHYIAQTSDISGGTDDGKDPSKPGSLLLCGDPNWTDFRFSAFLRATNNEGAMGVVFRHTAPSTYYRFSMDRQRRYRRLVKVINGVIKILAEDDFIYRQNQDYLITVEAIGTSIRVYQDGSIIFEVLDSDIIKGCIGLYCWSNPGVHFSDIRVDDFHKNAPVPYRFKFTTSQFTNFFHLLHSYQDEILPATLSPTANISSLLDQAVVSPTTMPIVDEITDEEMRAYEKLLAQVPGIQPHQNPSQVQVTRVEQNNKAFAFLIRSPEPIDWKRTLIECQSADRRVPAPQLPGAVKMTDVTFGKNKPNEESVTLLLREATDLTGHRIEQRVMPGPLTESGSLPALLVDDFNGPDGGVLFYEEFGPNALDHYTLVNEEPPGGSPSNWKVANGRIEQRGDYRGGPPSEYSLPERPGTIALLKSGELSNVHISATLRTDSQRDIGIVFRYQDNDNYYRLSLARYDASLNTSFRRLIKKVGGTVTVLWQDSFRNDTTQPIRIVIETFGDQLVGYVDSSLLFCLQDSDIARGGVGFYCWGNNRAYFEALQVESLESNPILWQPLLQDMSELTIVDDSKAGGGASNWNANGGVLTQSVSLIGGEEQAWEMLPGSASDIAVGDYGLVWCTLAVSSSIYRLFRWNGNDWDSISGGRVNAVRIAVDPLGMPWVIDNAQQIFRWDGKAFQKLPGSAFDIAIGAGITYIAGTNAMSEGPGIYYLDGDDSWQLLGPRGPTYGRPHRLAVGQDGRPWIVNHTHQIFVLRSDYTWEQFPYMANDIGVGSDGSVWIVGTDASADGYRIYRWNGIAWNEVLSSGGIGIAVSPDGNPWIVNNKKRISRWNGNVYHKPGTYVLGGSSGWRDIQISASLRSVSSGAIGVMFRYADADNYYRFSIDRQGNYRRLIKNVDGKVTKLWEDQVQYSVGQTYELTIRDVDGRLSVYVDSILLFSPIYDTEIKIGRVGLYCHANAGARFERVMVKDCTRRVGQWTIKDEAQEGVASRWRLMRDELSQTSNIGSGDVLAGLGTLVVAGDHTWANYRLIARMRSDTDAAIGMIFRYVDADNYYRLSIDAKVKKYILTKKVNGVFTPISDKPGGFKVSESFTVTVDAVGTKLVAYIENERIFEVTDNTFTAGQVGFSCWSNNAARFEYVEVSRPPLEASAILRDRFVEGDISGWRIVDEGSVNAPSDWKIVDGGLCQLSSINTPLSRRDRLSNRGTQAVAGDSNWTDVMASTLLESPNGSAIGVLFRYRDRENYYRFSMDSQQGYRHLVKKVGGTFKLLWDDKFAYEAGLTHEFTVVAVGNILRGYMNGVPMFVVEDSSLTTGQIGLYCFKNMDARFSDVRVYEADRAFNEWLINDQFTILNPSRWAFSDEGKKDRPSKWGVVDGELRQTSNIYSVSRDPSAPGTYAVAGDGSWTDYRASIQIRSDDNDSIGVMFRYTDTNNYYRFSMNRQSKYRRLIKKVAGQVKVLWEDTTQYILKHAYMLTLDCNGSQLTVYLDGVRLFTIEDGDLLAGKIGLYCSANTGARFSDVRIASLVWMPYYTFSKESHLEAGTLVRVYAGSLKDAPPEETGIIQRFVVSLNDHGRLRLQRESVDLRVLVSSRGTGHRRQFLSDNLYKPLDAKNLRILRKEDGTGFFLMISTAPPAIAPLIAGQYRLEMTYYRKIKDESQIFSQAGNSDPEKVIIDFPWEAQ